MCYTERTEGKTIAKVMLIIETYNSENDDMDSRKHCSVARVYDEKITPELVNKALKGCYEDIARELEKENKS